MDQDFSDISIKDTIDNKNYFKIFFNTIISTLLLFAIISIFITIININKISNNEKGYFIHDVNVTSNENYTLTTYHYLCYKIVKVNNNSNSNIYFRFWFMSDIDY